MHECNASLSNFDRRKERLGSPTGKGRHLAKTAPSAGRLAAEASDASEKAR